MIPSEKFFKVEVNPVYQRGLVIDSQRGEAWNEVGDSISKGIGD